MFLSVDRIEEAVAVCEREDGSFLRLPLEELPPGIREGMVLREEAGGYVPDMREEQRRREEILRLQKALFQE